MERLQHSGSNTPVWCLPCGSRQVVSVTRTGYSQAVPCCPFSVAYYTVAIPALVMSSIQAATLSHMQDYPPCSSHSHRRFGRPNNIVAKGLSHSHRRYDLQVSCACHFNPPVISLNCKAQRKLVRPLGEPSQFRSCAITWCSQHSQHWKSIVDWGRAGLAEPLRVDKLCVSMP